MCILEMIKNYRKMLPTKRKTPRTNYEIFLQKGVPIIMITGPPLCGKTTMAEMLHACSNFALLKIDELTHTEVGRRTDLGDQIGTFIKQNKPVPSNLVVRLLRVEIISTYIENKGFIIDGFPKSAGQLSSFRRKVCKPTVVVYMDLNIDALFSRAVAKTGNIDLDELRIRYIRERRKTESLYNKYEQSTYKMFAAYPPENTCNRVIEHLEDNYGFKFVRMNI